MLRSPSGGQPAAPGAANDNAVPMRNVGSQDRDNGSHVGAPAAAPPTSAAATAAARRVWWLKARIFGLTFLSYAIYSGTRQAFGITKAALNPDTDKEPTADGFAPFNSREWGSTYLGACDTVFLSAYAVGLFITGPLGDRLNLRWFLGLGMIGAGLFCFGFGSAALLDVHHLAFFIAMNLGAGLFQATGWPANVTLMTRWFGSGSRGLVMGFWNAHSSVGNICGKFIATAAMHHWGWGYAFMCMGSVCAGVGLVQLLFVVPHPSDVLSPPELAELERINARGHVAKVAEAHTENGAATAPYHTAFRINVPHAPVPREVALALASPPPPLSASTDLLQPVADRSGAAATRSSSVSSCPDAADGVAQRHHDDYESISFAQALLVPGVLAYSACLFFSKLVAYAFIFWLPFYLSNLNYTDTEAGNISTVYDIGGVAGGIIAGYASDLSGKRGLVSVTMLLLSLPGLWAYSFLAQYGMAINIVLMFIVGILVNGPYTLVSSAVAADLGSHPSLRGNPKAMSTVTGIIDGCGSVGAALQGVIIGLAGKRMGWTKVFYLLMGFCLLSALTLQRVVRREVGPWSTWRPLSFWCCGRQRRVDTRPHTPSPPPHDDQHTDVHEHSHSRSHSRRHDAHDLDRSAAEEDQAVRDEQHDELTEEALATHLAYLHAAGGARGNGGGGGSGSAPRSQAHTRNSSADSTVVAEFGEDGDVHLLRSSRRATAAGQRRSSASANNNGAAASATSGTAAPMQTGAGVDGCHSPEDEFAHTVASGAYKPYHSPASQIAADLKASLLRR